ncbi:unnamed protein product [Prorocentrum cordatum]|uniref:Ion transport domain-containing protein n=1 Tax=Prorocentrum cordatum TaxID=2364126 RepID=A0ABN9P947_9DINO|nr:unnamed protein product [Polarella glacialis]
MTLDCFKDSVLPAWHALMSKASTSFLGILVLAIFGVLFSFISLPRLSWEFNEVPGPDMFSNGNTGILVDLKQALYIVQRMTLMGDFDEDVIEGRGRSIFFTFNRTAKSFHTGSMPKTAATETAMTNELPFFCLAMALGFGVLMNLYIGILSNEYNKAISDLKRLTGRHRIIVSFPHLLNMYGRSQLGLTGPDVFLQARAGLPNIGCLQEDSSVDSGFWFALPAKNQKTKRTAFLTARTGADTCDLGQAGEAAHDKVAVSGWKTTG